MSLEHFPGSSDAEPSRLRRIADFYNRIYVEVGLAEIELMANTESLVAVNQDDKESVYYPPIHDDTL